MSGTTGEDIVYNPDYRADAEGRLLSQFQNSPRIVSLIRALATGVQAYEDEQFGVLVSTTFTAATGHDLDIWGALVGESRGDLGDADYRRMISARILANRCRGTRDELIYILQQITEPSTVTHTDLYPAAFQMVVKRETPLSDSMARRVGALMRDIKPGGVGMMIIEAVTGYYGFDPDPDAEPLDVGTFSRLL